MKKRLLSMFIVALFFIAAYSIYTKLDQLSTLPEDILISTKLTENTNEKMKHKDYMLEVFIDKKKASQNMIYPYMKGLHSMSFDSNEEEGFFVPISIGVDPGDEKKVFDKLKEHRLIEPNTDDPYGSLVGFWSPQEIGSSRMRMYFQADNDFKVSNEMYLVYVHKEKGLLGREKSWTKLVKIHTE